MKKYIYKHRLIAIVLIIFYGCKKSSFLETRPDDSLVVPTSLKDLQAILDNDAIMNGNASGVGLMPNSGEISYNSYYVNDANFGGVLTPLEQKLYKWDKQPFTGEPNILDWDLPYRSVFYSNVVLDGLKKITPEASQQSEFNNIYYSALFYRAHIFYQLAQIFAPVYASETASTDWGIPLRLTADVNEEIRRSTVAETYSKIIEDLKSCAGELTTNPLYKTRPSKQAACALLARVYLSMRNYDSAFVYADKSLQLYNKLVDYNILMVTNTNFPFLNIRFNDEVIFHCLLRECLPLRLGAAIVDNTIYNSYNNNDLRKADKNNDLLKGAFYRFISNTYSFRGSYYGSVQLFSGLATDELYLIRAECFARKNSTSQALSDLNALLIKRWRNTVQYTQVTATDAADALNKILEERKRELMFRGLFWTDLRRLNKEGRNISFTRTVLGQTYTLPPNDLRYTFPIPDNVINFNPGMPQNPRQ